MNASRTDLVRRPFVLTDEHLRLLAERVSTVGDVRYTLKCADSLSRTTHSVDEVLKFDNSPQRAVVEITLKARSTNHETHASVSLGNSAGNNVEIGLDGPEEVIVFLNQEIESRLAAMKPWYAPLTRSDFSLLALKGLLGLFVLVALLSVGLFIWGPAPTGFSSPAQPSFPSPRQLDIARVIQGLLTLLLMWIGSTILVMFLADIGGKGRRWLFPVGVFAIGAGKSRHEFHEKIRWAVATGVFGLLVAGIGTLLKLNFR